MGGFGSLPTGQRISLFYLVKEKNKKMENDTPSYYAVIPADVRYDKRLKANEKLMYGEITCLSQKEGYCYEYVNGFISAIFCRIV